MTSINSQIVTAILVLATFVALLVVHLKLAALIWHPPVSHHSFLRLIGLCLLFTVFWMTALAQFGLDYIVSDAVRSQTEQLEYRVLALTFGLPGFFPFIPIGLAGLGLLPLLSKAGYRSVVYWIAMMLSTAYIACFCAGGTTTSALDEPNPANLPIVVVAGLGALSGVLWSVVNQGRAQIGIIAAWAAGGATSAILGLLLGAARGQEEVRFWTRLSEGSGQVFQTEIGSILAILAAGVALGLAVGVLLSLVIDASRRLLGGTTQRYIEER